MPKPVRSSKDLKVNLKGGKEPKRWANDPTSIQYTEHNPKKNSRKKKSNQSSRKANVRQTLFKIMQ